MTVKARTSWNSACSVPNCHLVTWPGIWRAPSLQAAHLMNGVGGSQPAEIDKRSADATDLTAGVTDLYVSTFKALALVLDAKYRLTNGHVRRVQHNAVRLAREMGIVDPALLKAI